MIRSLCLAIMLIASLSATSTRAAVHSYFANLDGPSEDPPVASTGVGFARLDYDDVAHSLFIDADFSGLVSPTAIAHIHAPTPTPFAMTAGVATPVPTFPGFPEGVTSGSYTMTFDLTQESSWNPAYVTSQGGTTATAEAAFATHLADGLAYLNVHTEEFGGGEIRGFWRLVPEPATASLIAIGAFAMLIAPRRMSRLK